MKKFIYPILFLLFSVHAIAQQHRERVKALKVSFITEKLDLTAQEAQQFWPVFNSYEKAVNKIKHEDIRNIRREIRRTINTLSDSRAKELVLKLNQAETALHKERIALSSKLLKIIPPKKIILLKVAEEDFKRKMLERYRSKGHKGQRN